MRLGIHGGFNYAILSCIFLQPCSSYRKQSTIHTVKPPTTPMANRPLAPQTDRRMCFNGQMFYKG